MHSFGGSSTRIHIEVYRINVMKYFFSFTRQQERRTGSLQVKMARYDKMKEEPEYFFTSGQREN